MWKYKALKVMELYELMWLFHTGKLNHIYREYIVFPSKEAATNYCQWHEVEFNLYETNLDNDELDRILDQESFTSEERATYRHMSSDMAGSYYETYSINLVKVIDCPLDSISYPVYVNEGAAMRKLIQ